MNKTEKKVRIEELSNSLKNTQLAVFASFRGIGTPEVFEKRKKAKSDKADFQLVKNRFLKKALAEIGVDSAAPGFWKDEIAILKSTNGDPIRLAQMLTDWAGQNKKVKIKGALLPTKKTWLTPEDVVKISKLGSLKQVQASVVGALVAPNLKLMGILNTVLSQLVWILQAKCQQEKA